jgi:ATP-dependent RNA helicase DeaD
VAQDQNPSSDPAAVFRALGVDEAIAGAVAALGYEEPTPIQREAIPALAAGRDVLGQAATGTGKTAAFALPLLSRLRGPIDGPPRALVLVPTRELAMQVSEALHRYGRPRGLRSIPVFGGQPIDRQLKALKRGVDVVVATPGRALDHVRRRTLRLETIEVLVLDEADEMLDMGFAEDLEAILAGTPPGRQTALFSATMPPRIAAIAERHLRDPLRIRIAPEGMQKGALPRIRQTAYLVPRAQKLAALARVLDVEQPAATLVFCRTRLEVDELVEGLNARGYPAEALHGGYSQELRDRVMRRLREGASELLVATDVAARGLDVDRLTHVVNYDVPSSPGDYVHRIGRTGRAGREGVAVTLLEPREHRLLRNIEQLTRQKITIGVLPTVADLRTRRLELTRAALREALVGGDLERYRVVVDSLSDEFDVVEIAMAAVRLAHVAAGGERAEEEIVASTLPAERPRGGKQGPRKGPRGGGWKAARVVLGGAGRKAGVKPGDLVGAIVNETGLRPQAIGSITIEDDAAIVELPEEMLGELIPALKRLRIKGKKPTVSVPAPRANKKR